MIPKRCVRDRRSFLRCLSSAALYGAFDRVHSASTARVGYLFAGTRQSVEPLIAAFESELAAQGRSHANGISVEYVFSSPDPEKLRQSAFDLARKSDVLVVSGTICAIAARDAGVRSPVVFPPAGFPFELGLVRSLKRPGTNFTGVSFEAAEDTYGKRLQMLKEIVPHLRIVAAIGDATDLNIVPSLDSLHRSAPQLGIEVLDVKLDRREKLDVAFARIPHRSVQGLVVIAGVFTYGNRAALAELALSHGFPSIHAFKESVADGALLSLGPDLVVIASQAADYVDKILGGVSPADLPVQQPSRYEVGLNLTSARRLRLEVPPSLLSRADQIVQ